MDQHYPVKDVASRLACSEETVRRLIRGGQLKAVRLGRDYRVSENAIACSLKPTQQKAT
jgi:excisionase family DNA binding protein